MLLQQIIQSIVCFFVNFKATKSWWETWLTGTQPANKLSPFHMWSPACCFSFHLQLYHSCYSLVCFSLPLASTSHISSQSKNMHLTTVPSYHSIRLIVVVVAVASCSSRITFSFTHVVSRSLPHLDHTVPPFCDSNSLLGVTSDQRLLCEPFSSGLAVVSFHEYFGCGVLSHCSLCLTSARIPMHDADSSWSWGSVAQGLACGLYDLPAVRK